MSSIDSNLAAKYFGKNPDSKGATELMRRSPAEYHRLKEIALAEGLIVRKDYQDPEYRRRFEPKQFSQDELKILAEIPESETRRFYCNPSDGGSDTLAKLATERPDYYNKVRASAMLRGLIPSAPIAPQPEPKPTSQFITVSDADCDTANLPRGYKTTAQGLETIKRVVAEVEQKRVEAQQLAAKTAAQLERDRIADESVAEFGRLLEINREHAQKQRAQNGNTVEKVEVPVKA
jgi:hypothetical protein